MKRRLFLGLLPTLLVAATGICSPPNPHATRGAGADTKRVPQLQRITKLSFSRHAGVLFAVLEYSQAPL
jgi:hypothetical protein